MPIYSQKKWLSELVFSKFNTVIYTNNTISKLNEYQRLRNAGVTASEALATTGLSAATVKAAKSNGILTVSEGVKSGAIKSSTKAILAQTAAWATSPMGMATIAITGISLLISGIKAYNQKVQESRQELMQLGQQAADTNKQLYDLISQYSKLGKDGQIDLSDQETAKGIQEQIVELVGDQAKNIDLVNGKYDEEIEKLQQIKALGVGDSYNDISRAAKSAEANLRDGYLSKGVGGSDNTIMGGAVQTATESAKIKEVMTKNGFGDFGKEYYEGTYKFQLDTSTPEKMVESYYKAVELASVIARDYGEDIENSEGALYDFYNNLNKFIDNNKEDVEAYSAAIKNLHTMDANSELANFLKTNDIATQEDFDSYIKGIEDGTIGMVDGKEASDSYKQVLIDVANDAFPQFSNSAKDAGENVNKMTVSMESLNKEIDAIQSAYQAVESAIKEFNTTGSLSVDTYQALTELEAKYIPYLIDEQGNLTLTKDALNELTAARIREAAVKQAEDYIDYIAGLGSEKAQIDAITTSVNEETDAINARIAAKLNEKITDGIISKDVAKKMLGHINGIIGMAESAIAGLDSGGLAKNAADNAKKVAEAEEEYAKKVADINEDLAEKEKQFAENMAEAWKKEHLEQLKDGLSKQKDIIDKYKKNLEITDFGFDLLNESDFESKSTLLSQKLIQLTEYGSQMRQEFDRIANIIPQTGDEANELANRIEELGSDMRENISSIRETQVEIQKLRVEALAFSIDKHTSAFEAELSNIERRIEILNNDNQQDFKYTNEILLAQSLLPMWSDFEKQKREKQRQDRDLIKQEQNTQDTINKIVSDALEQQAKDNATARAKERQKLIEDLEKTRKEAKEKLADAKKDFDEHMDSLVTKTQSAMASVQSLLDETDLKVPKLNTSDFDESVEHINNSLKGIGSSSVYNIFDKIEKWSPSEIKLPLSDSKAAVDIQGGDNCVKYAYARKKEITGTTNNIWYSGNGGDLGDKSLGDRKIKTPSDYRSYLMSGALITMSNGKAINPQANKPYGHVVVVESYDPITDILTYSDNTTGRTAKTIKFSDFSKRNSLTGVIPFGVYADGTPNHPGGLAVVGDEFKGAYEAIILPDGTVKILGVNGSELVDLPRGTEVVPHDQTKSLMTALEKKVPKYSNGTVNSNEIQEKIDEIVKFEEDSQKEIDRITNEGVVSQIQIQQSYYSPEIEKRLLHQLAISQGKKGAQYAARKYQQLRDDFLNYWNSGEYNEEVINAYYDSFDKLENVIYDFECSVSDNRSKILDEEIKAFHNLASEKFDIDISKLNSRSTLLSSHFNIVNAISEEQHNLNKELLEAEIVGARMNEQERSSLFTKSEHTKLSSKLSGIMSDINDLQRSYTRDLNKATKNTIEEITNNYERQYELKMKEYEIVKAELALAKAQQILENVENEKSVRTWNGSNWVYTAVLQDVIDAQADVEDAKYELEKSMIEKVQQEQLNAIDNNVDRLQTEKNKLEAVIKEMSESEKDVVTVLQNIAEVDLPTFKLIMQESGKAIQEAFDISDDTIDQIINEATENDIIDKMKQRSSDWRSANDTERKRLESKNIEDAKKIGLDFEESTGRWKRKDGTYAYATGTSNAEKGIGLFDEEGFGSEIILTKDGILTQFDGGERVFSPEMADRLWQMAQQKHAFAPLIAQPDLNKLIPIEDKINNAISNISNAFGDTYMIKDVQLNESEGGTLKGFIDFLKKKI